MPSQQRSGRWRTHTEFDAVLAVLVGELQATEYTSSVELIHTPSPVPLLLFDLVQEPMQVLLSIEGRKGLLVKK